MKLITLAIVLLLLVLSGLNAILRVAHQAGKVPYRLLEHVPEYFHGKGGT